MPGMMIVKPNKKSRVCKMPPALVVVRRATAFESKDFIYVKVSANII
jgi:hypothetical protein